ncbi:MAG TPA: hypothetical protein VK195_00120 [Burkholderiaceae bacterium]|nr:hypothetical protein [Burkholderiaceae bacterium]
MEKPIEIRLTQDEALVLCEFFARFQETNRLRLINNAEFIALSRISEQIDHVMAQPFQPDYGELLEAPRKRLSDEFEGVAPGIEP